MQKALRSVLILISYCSGKRKIFSSNEKKILKKNFFFEKIIVVFDNK